MRLSDLSAGDVVTEVYSYYLPSQVWDVDRMKDAFDLERAKEPFRMYCKTCRSHGTTRPTKDFEGKNAWYCKACETTNRHVLMLQRHGTVHATSTRSSKKDYDWQIVDGILAGRVMTAIEKAPQPITSWAIWAHTANPASIHQQRIFNYLRDKVLDGDQQVGRPVDHAEAFKRFIIVNELIDDWRRPKPVKLDTLAKIADVSPTQFVKSRRWGRLVRACRIQFDELEHGIDEAVRIALNYKPVFKEA